MRKMFLFALSLSSYLSFGAVSLSPAAGFNLDTPKLQGSSGTIASTGKVTLAGGMGVGILLYRSLEFESGGYYAPRKYSFNSGLVDETNELTSLVIPVLLRLRFSRFFSIGAGAFAGFAIGKIKASTSTATIEYTYNEAQVHDINYGVMGNVSLELPISKSLFFVIEGRYYYGLQDLLRSAIQKLETRELQALWGFRIIL